MEWDGMEWNGMESINQRKKKSITDFQFRTQEFTSKIKNKIFRNNNHNIIIFSFSQEIPQQVSKIIIDFDSEQYLFYAAREKMKKYARKATP
jgi:hypothetical protein